MNARDKELAKLPEEDRTTALAADIKVQVEQSGLSAEAVLKRVKEMVPHAAPTVALHTIVTWAVEEMRAAQRREEAEAKDKAAIAFKLAVLDKVTA